MYTLISPSFMNNVVVNTPNENAATSLASRGNAARLCFVNCFVASSPSFPTPNLRFISPSSLLNPSSVHALFGTFPTNGAPSTPGSPSRLTIFVFTQYARIPFSARSEWMSALGWEVVKAASAASRSGAVRGR